MTRRATFTQVELARAIRAAEALGTAGQPTASGSSPEHTKPLEVTTLEPK